MMEPTHYVVSGVSPPSTEEHARLLARAVPALIQDLMTSRPGQLYREALLRLERPLLAHVLALTGGNQLRAARLLGLNRNTLRKRCRALGLDVARSHRLRSASASERNGPGGTR